MLGASARRLCRADRLSAASAALGVWLRADQGQGGAAAWQRRGPAARARAGVGGVEVLLQQVGQALQVVQDWVACARARRGLSASRGSPKLVLPWRRAQHRVAAGAAGLLASALWAPTDAHAARQPQPRRPCYGLHAPPMARQTPQASARAMRPAQTGACREAAHDSNRVEHLTLPCSELARPWQLAQRTLAVSVGGRRRDAVAAHAAAAGRRAGRSAAPDQVGEQLGRGLRAVMLAHLGREQLPAVARRLARCAPRFRSRSRSRSRMCTQARSRRAQARVAASISRHNERPCTACPLARWCRCPCLRACPYWRQVVQRRRPHSRRSAPCRHAVKGTCTIAYACRTGAHAGTQQPLK